MKVANSELIVLQALWKESPLTIGQIVARIQPVHDWHENTIKTLVTRLLKKGALSREKDGKQYFYQPAVAESAIIDAESKHFLGRFFEGSLGGLVAHFADKKKLSQQDLAEIEAILERMKND